MLMQILCGELKLVYVKLSVHYVLSDLTNGSMATLLNRYNFIERGASRAVTSNFI